MSATMKDLLEEGVHLGHQTQRWNPKMEKYIYGDKSGINILDLLAYNKIFSSKSEVRRAIKNNAIKINNIVLYDEKKSVNIEDFGDDKILKISFGKKKHYILKII